MQQILSTLRDSWSKLSRPVQIGGGLLVAGVFLSLILLALFSSTEYQPLFTNVSPEDAAAVLQQLRDSGIPYRLEQNGTTILVPERSVHETRLNLASQGIPRGGVVGFEIFQGTRLGETEADRELRFLWALQGELTRTIRDLREVDDARVHIVMPRRSLFIQESQQATASVLLHLVPGVRLTPSQVRGIAHLIATSVEGLSPENVTIVDDRGNVLNDPSNQQQQDGEIMVKKLELERSYERQLEAGVVSMLERVYGFGNVVALASVELDFHLLEEYSETFAPVMRDGGIVRSEQTYEELQRTLRDGPEGIPGVDTNVPGYVGPGNEENTETHIREAIINYEINRTERRISNTPGSVKRLSIAVWINGELQEAERLSLQESVARAVGVQAQRGDSVYVDSRIFPVDPLLVSEVPVEQVPFIPLWALVAVPLTILGAGFLFYRRKKKADQEKAAELARIEREAAAAAEAESEEVLTPEEKDRKDIRQRILTAAKERPQDVASLLKTWLMDE